MEVVVYSPLHSLLRRSRLASFQHTQKRCSLRVLQVRVVGKSLHVLCMREALQMQWERRPIPVNRVKQQPYSFPLKA